MIQIMRPIESDNASISVPRFSLLSPNLIYERSNYFQRNHRELFIYYRLTLTENNPRFGREKLHLQKYIDSVTGKCLICTIINLRSIHEFFSVHITKAYGQCYIIITKFTFQVPLFSRNKNTFFIGDFNRIIRAHNIMHGILKIIKYAFFRTIKLKYSQ